MMNLKWFAMGLGLGAAIAVLYTPRAGAETREMLREKVDEASRCAVGTIQEESWSITDVIRESQDDTTRKAGASSGAAVDQFSEAV